MAGRQLSVVHIHDAAEGDTIEDGMGRFEGNFEERSSIFHLEFIKVLRSN
jgi:hypothetical protein